MNAVDIAPASAHAANAGAPAARFAGEPSMWFFIIGDLLIFGFYFVCYMYYRGQNQELFLQSQQHLNQGSGVINTLILLTSSLFVALATESLRRHRLPSARRLMAVGVAFGAIFPLLKVVEWVPKLSAGLTPGENLFFTFYYMMAGMHLCHVLLGLGILGFVLRDLHAPEPDVKFVETGAVYWHMVDLLWIVLFALLYLMR
jgi:nitric oxide reductase NorE protein